MKARKVIAAILAIAIIASVAIVPASASGSFPFTDGKPSSWYYSAVKWAYEKGITVGTTATTFSPNQHVTRGQALTFLYRYAGSPSVNYSYIATVSNGKLIYMPYKCYLGGQNITSQFKTLYKNNKDVKAAVLANKKPYWLGPLIWAYATRITADKEQHEYITRKYNNQAQTESAPIGYLKVHEGCPRDEYTSYCCAFLCRRYGLTKSTEFSRDITDSNDLSNCAARGWSLTYYKNAYDGGVMNSWPATPLSYIKYYFEHTNVQITPFADVKPMVVKTRNWSAHNAYEGNYHPSVNYTAAIWLMNQWGLIYGVSNTSFSPKSILTRAQSVQILYKMYDNIQSQNVTASNLLSKARDTFTEYVNQTLGYIAYSGNYQTANYIFWPKGYREP